jgi:hypothetical protein
MRTTARAPVAVMPPSKQQLGKEKMKKKSKTFIAQEKDTRNPRLAETVARYKARREAVGRDLFQDHDFAIVALIAALISGEHNNPDDAADHALRILDASPMIRRKISRPGIGSGMNGVWVGHHFLTADQLPLEVSPA